MTFDVVDPFHPMAEMRANILQPDHAVMARVARAANARKCCIRFDSIEDRR
jgi:hypothetical protein